MEVALTIESQSGLYTGRLAYDLPPDGWQVGDIKAPDRPEPELRELAQAAVDNMTAVAPHELAYSDCTDGRFRLSLQDEVRSPVPLREKLVGSDIMTAFAMAEMLGDRFYKGAAAPVAERLSAVADWLSSNDRALSTHKSCGGAGGLVSIMHNAVRFARQPNFMKRQQEFVPVYEPELYRQMVTGYAARLIPGTYEGYSDALVTQLVQAKSGGYGIAEYRDDGSGVHGHKEELIIRIKNRAGVTIDANALAARTGGRQVFVMNDSRLAQLAELFGRGCDDDYRVAYMAGEAYTDAGHGTLATGLPTLVIEPVA